MPNKPGKSDLNLPGKPERETGMPVDDGKGLLGMALSLYTGGMGAMSAMKGASSAMKAKNSLNKISKVWQ